MMLVQWAYSFLSHVQLRFCTCMRGMYQDHQMWAKKGLRFTFTTMRCTVPRLSRGQWKKSIKIIYLKFLFLCLSLHFETYTVRKNNWIMKCVIADLMHVMEKINQRFSSEFFCDYSWKFVLYWGIFFEYATNFSVFFFSFAEGWWACKSCCQL